LDICKTMDLEWIINFAYGCPLELHKLEPTKAHIRNPKYITLKSQDPSLIHSTRHPLAPDSPRPRDTPSTPPPAIPQRAVDSDSMRQAVVTCHHFHPVPAAARFHYAPHRSVPLHAASHGHADTFLPAGRSSPPIPGATAGTGYDNTSPIPHLLS
jgi:hypothetical protein